MLLIRDPAEVVASYVRSREACEPDDIGLLQQERLLDAAGAGRHPGRSTPATSCATPRRTCAGCATGSGSRSPTGCCPGRPGPRDSDGVWAPYWYDAVWRSTGFEPWRPREVDLSPHDAAVAEACRPAYDALHALRLRLS